MRSQGDILSTQYARRFLYQAHAMNIVYMNEGKDTKFAQLYITTMHRSVLTNRK